MVAGTDDPDQVTGPERLVHGRRPAAADRLAESADPPHLLITGTPAQGVLPADVSGQMQVDVRAERPGRQVCAVGVLELD